MVLDQAGLTEKVEDMLRETMQMNQDHQVSLDQDHLEIGLGPEDLVTRLAFAPAKRVGQDLAVGVEGAEGGLEEAVADLGAELDLVEEVQVDSVELRTSLEEEIETGAVEAVLTAKRYILTV